MIVTFKQNIAISMIWSIIFQFFCQLVIFLLNLLFNTSLFCYLLICLGIPSGELKLIITDQANFFLKMTIANICSVSTGLLIGIFLRLAEPFERAQLLISVLIIVILGFVSFVSSWLSSILLGCRPIGNGCFTTVLLCTCVFNSWC